MSASTERIARAMRPSPVRRSLDRLASSSSPNASPFQIVALRSLALSSARGGEGFRKPLRNPNLERKLARKRLAWDMNWIHQGEWFPRPRVLRQGFLYSLHSRSKAFAMSFAAERSQSAFLR
jgi:hypothetical protein